MMLVAGGPGQGSATVFNLSDKDSADLYHALFPGYRIVAFDNRGTGKSGLLVCSALQQSTTFVGQDTLAAGCAASIGPNRDFYSTHDHADDTEAVRVALGVDKIALWGTSYGTKLALAYALAYPTHVERLLLDSVLPTEYPEPLEANVLHDMPLALSSYCARRRVPCRNPELRGRRRGCGERARPHAGPRCRAARERVGAERAHGRPRHARARRRLGSEPGPRGDAPGGDPRRARSAGWARSCGFTTSTSEARRTRPRR